MVALALIFGLQAWAAPQKLNLEQTVLFAVERSPRLNSILREATISRYERKNVLAAFFPSLDLNATHGLIGRSPRISDNPWSSDFSLDLTENLYDNGRNITQYRISRLKEDLANQRFLLERDKLSRDVALEFLRFSQSAKNLEVQEEQLRVLRKQFDAVASGYRAGWKPQRDYLRFKAQVNRSEIQIVSARNAVEKAKERLQNVLAADSSTPLDFTPLSDFHFTGKIPDQALDARSHREYQIGELQKRVSQLESDLVHRKLWPELNFTTGAAYKSSSYLGPGAAGFRDNDHLEWNALLNLKFNFLDWGTRSRDAAIATERSLIQENEVSIRLLDLREELNNLVRDLQEKQKSYALNKELLDLENKNLQNISTDYREGRATYLDYINGLDALSSARLAYYATFFDLQQGIYAYLYHQGAVYEAIRKK